MVGITLSTEQLALATERVKAKGLDHLVSFELVGLRIFAEECLDRNRSFDRIVSCEMIEAVGHDHLGSFFATVDVLLRGDGIFVMQVTIIIHQHHHQHHHH